MGAGTEKYAGVAQHLARAPGRPRREEPRAAAAAIKDGRFNDEIIAVEIPQRKGDPLLFDTDEGVRPGTTLESLGALKPAFDKAGNITAGNASQLSDGASAVIVDVEGGRERLAREPARRGRRLRPGRRPRSRRCCTSRSRAIQAALEKAGKSVADVDLFEINEAFAAVGVASMDDLGITDDVVNVNGGAIALGHPIGMSRQPPCAHAAARAAPPRRWRRCRRAVRRRRSGRRAAPQDALAPEVRSFA